MSQLSDQSRPSVYMPQLDGIRAICVFMVFVAHWIPESGRVPFGPLGVYGFFVLSGFLITGILLGMREEAGAPKRSLWDKLKTFMMRRSLRIFPAYFVLVFALILFDQDVRERAVWYLTYTVNALICWRGSWNGVMGHLWSLAMEEQFYLVWPWLMWLLPWKRISWVFGITMGVGMASRGIIAAKGYAYPVDYVFPLSSLDFFAVGGMLAWVRINHPSWWQALCAKGWRWGLPLAALLGFGFVIRWHGPAWQVARIGLVALIWGLLVAGTANGFGGVMGKTLSARPLVWMGKISYGLYLLHPLSPKAINWVCGAVGWHGWYDLNALVRFPICMAATLVGAAASFYCFEQPFLRLKKHWK